MFVTHVNRPNWFGVLTKGGKKLHGGTWVRARAQITSHQLTLTSVRRVRVVLLGLSPLLGLWSWFRRLLTLVPFCQAAECLRSGAVYHGRDGGHATWEPDMSANGAESSWVAAGD